MTISSQPVRTTYSCSGTTGPYAFPFRFLENADLAVTRIDAAALRSKLTLGADYSVTGAGVDAGGAVSTTASYTDGHIEIWLDLAITQESSFPSGGPFPASANEDALDRLTLIAAQQGEDATRNVQVPFGESGLTLPGLSSRANTYLGFDPQGKPIAVDVLPQGATTPFVNTLLASANASAFLVNLGAQARIIYDVTDSPYGAVLDGRDITANVQAAINAAAILPGGGRVRIPSSGGVITGSLSIVSHGIVLCGATADTTLTFNNAALDCIVIDGTAIGGAGVYNWGVENIFLSHSLAKTGGATFKLTKANQGLFADVWVNNPYNGIDAFEINNIIWRGGGIFNPRGLFGAKISAPSDGTGRSDVFAFSKSVINCGGFAPTGILCDGMMQTLRLDGFAIIGAVNALVVQNTIPNTTYYPGFVFGLDFEADGCTGTAILIKAGADFDFAASSVFCVAGAPGPVIQVQADLSESYTNSFRWVGGRIAGGQGVILDFDGKNLQLTGASLGDGSQAGVGAAEVIKIGPHANDCQITGNQLGQFWGAPLNHSYGITVANGAFRIVASNNSMYGCQTGEVLDNSTSGTVDLGGGLNIAGIPVKAFSGVWQQRRDWAGATEIKSYNGSVGAAVEARVSHATGTPNSYVVNALKDNNGAPYLERTIGAAVTEVLNDADLEIWRSTAGVEKFRSDTNHFKSALPMASGVTTVAGLAAFAAVAGDRAFVTDANVVAAGNFGTVVGGGGANKVPVYYDGAAWRIG